MYELDIKRNRFEDSKNKIKKFSEQKPQKINLRKVDNSKDLGERFIDGFFKGEGFSSEHKVTGRELNELTGQIQEYLIKFNKGQIKLIQEFKDVYDALEALDKDYIEAIVLSIKATEDSSKVIKENQEKISKNHDRIDKLFANQKETLEVLLKFKKELSQYEHLENIDDVWETTEKNSREIELQKEHTSVFEKQIQLINERIRKAYIVAGSAIGMTLVELILIMIKVI